MFSCVIKTKNKMRFVNVIDINWIKELRKYIKNNKNVVLSYF